MSPEYTGRFVGIILLVVALIWLLESAGLFQGIDNYYYDLGIRLRGPRQHDNRIVIAAIDEKTLDKLGRWPIDRSYYAQLLDIFHSAAAVGINIILAESSDEDASLARAIAQHNRVILPVYIDSRLKFTYPVDSFAAAGLGHAHLEQEMDGFVRKVFHTISLNSVSIDSFAAVIYDLVSAPESFPPTTSMADTAKEQPDTIIQSDPMAINYYGPAGVFQYISVADIIEGQWPPSFFSDKIVLIGKTTTGLNEGILIPFSDNRNRMPGVEVHAHILNNLLDKVQIRPVADWIRWSGVLICAVGGFLLFVRLGIQKGILIGFFSLLAIFVMGQVLLTTADLWLRPTALYCAVTVVLIGAYIFNLQKMRGLLLQAKDDWEGSFNTIDDGITIQDEHGNILKANKAAEETFGTPVLDFLKLRCASFCGQTEDARTADHSVLKDGGIVEEIYLAELGRHMEIRSLPRFNENERRNGLVQVIRDITEKKNAAEEHQMMQRQLVQAQKMEAIGTLAGGITHDFNNILAAVMGYTELTLQELPPDSPLRDRLQQVLKAGLRAKALVGQILTFSRRSNQDIQPKSLEIGVIVKEAVKFLRSMLPSTIQIRSNILSNDKAIIDPSQMHQIVMNLATNAKHAMQANGGVLTIELIDMDIKPHSDQGANDPPLQPGPYLKLTVKDTGHGMAPDVMKRLFEPYFTTKEKGIGTGLGMATAQGIIQNNHGAITVESEVDQGTVFHVYLPRTDEIPGRGEAQPASPLPAGTERILFVDDEPELVTIGQAMLQNLGYQVVTKNNGLEALQEFRKQPDQFDLVLTDMTMPQMTGEKMAQELIKIRSDMPIILCTGYSELINASKAKQLGIKAFVSKPLTLSQLARTVRDVLDGKKVHLDTGYTND